MHYTMKYIARPQALLVRVRNGFVRLQKIDGKWSGSSVCFYFNSEPEKNTFIGEIRMHTKSSWYVELVFHTLC